MRKRPYLPAKRKYVLAGQDHKDQQRNVHHQHSHQNAPSKSTNHPKISPAVTKTRTSSTRSRKSTRTNQVHPGDHDLFFVQIKFLICTLCFSSCQSCITCHRKICRIATIKSSRPDCHPVVALEKKSVMCPRIQVWSLCARNVRNVSNSIIRKVKRFVPAI